MGRHHAAAVQAANNAQDWHRADIKAALEKAGWTLRSLARHHDVTHNTLTDTFYKPYPASERRIADAIGVDPSVIWPSRYTGRRANRSTGSAASHVKSRRAA